MEKEDKRNENFSRKVCNICDSIMEKDWKFCPICRTENNIARCQFCIKEIENGWNYCPFCKCILKTGKEDNEYLRRGNEWLKQQLEEYK